MPTVDQRLEQLFADVAAEPSADVDVFGAVARKRHQRHMRRVVRNAGVVVALLFVLAGSLAWLATDDGSEPAVAPTRRDPVSSRKLGDAWLGAQPVALAPDLGYVRGPLIQSGEYLELAAYDRDGSGGFKVPPARVVRIDASGRVLDKVDLQGEILSLADGEGARWVVTHDADNVATRRYRVKRIVGDSLPVSNEFPPGAEPIGPIVVGTGGAWVPVDGGVLRFDTATGAFREEVQLPGWRPRLVLIGPQVFAYASAVRPDDGQAQLVRLPSVPGESPTFIPTGSPLVSVAATPGTLWALTRSDGRTTIAPFDGNLVIDPTRAVALPKRFVGSELQAAGATLWVRGTFSDDQAGLVRIAVRSDGRAAASDPVMFRAPANSDVLGLYGREVLVAANGELYRVDIR